MVSKYEMKEVILSALRISRDDLLVQRGDHGKYAPTEDVEDILGEIDKHLDLLEEAEGYVKEIFSYLKD